MSKTDNTRYVVLDTETTGLDPFDKEGKKQHRIIEIACIEVVGHARTGRKLHMYFQPSRRIDAGAKNVHGITDEMLRNAPRFEHKAQEICDFLQGAVVVAHNAGFDAKFIDAEFGWAKKPALKEVQGGIIDTLSWARKFHPGQRNTLDALCDRYGVDRSHRDLHGALIDTDLLVDIFLLMKVAATMRAERSLLTTERKIEEWSAAPERLRGPVDVPDEIIRKHQDYCGFMSGMTKQGVLWQQGTSEATQMSP